MYVQSNATRQSTVTLGPAGAPYAALLWSSLGMLGFSFTLTATRLAVTQMNSVFVGLGRAVVAAALAGLMLAVRREALPSRRHWGALVRTSLGIVVGFPILSAIALESVPASHAQVVIGLSPMATAAVSAVRFGERLSKAFWAAAGGGAAAVLLLGWTYAGGGVRAPDLLLLFAVALVGLGYAEGGRLARELGGFRVIAWALVFALPVTLLGTIASLRDAAWLPAASAGAWSAFAYVSVVSMFLAFFPWYKGLSLGSIASASQVQLAMPVLGVLWAKLLLDERVEVSTLASGGLVILFAALAQLAARRPTAPGTQPIG